MLIRNYLFHRISDDTDPLWPPLKPRLFEKIVRYLKKNYLVVSLEEALSYPSNPGYKNKKIATILFDDGFRDNIEYAAPILDKYRIPASFFIVTDCIENKFPTWTYIIDYLLRHTKKNQLNIPFDWIEKDRHINEFSKMNERIQLAGWLKSKMKAMTAMQKKEVYSMAIDSFDDVELPDNMMMDWNHIMQLSGRGFSIGSHSASHAALAKIENDDELMLELSKSGNAIKKHLGDFPSTISYPNGYYDDRVILFARQAGYKYGLAVKQRFYDTSRDDLMAIPRLELYNEPYLKVLMRMWGIIRIFRKKVYDRIQK